MNGNDATLLRTVVGRVPDFVHDSYPKQQAYLTDRSRLIVQRCGRRAGKTSGTVRRHVTRLSLNPRTRAFYGMLTAPSVKRIAWRELHEINAVYKLDLKMNDSELHATLPNGSDYYMGGLDDPKMVARIRGEKLIEAAVGECQSFRSPVLRELVQDVLFKALSDLRGTLTLEGSSGKLKRGTWWDYAMGDRVKASRHAWTVFDNPYFKDPERAIREDCELNGYTVDHPNVRREWFNEWIADESEMVYLYSADRNLLTLERYEAACIGADGLPYPMTYVLALDFGFTGACAFVVLAFSYEDPKKKIYIIDAWKRTRLTPSACGEEVARAMTVYAFESIIGDAGGLGKGYIEEIGARFAIPIRSAIKAEKRGAIDFMNGDLADGRILLVEGKTRALSDEWDSLPWNDEKTEAAEGHEDHAADAALYGYRECRVHFGQVKTPKTNPDDPEEHWSRAGRRPDEDEDPWSQMNDD